MCQLRLAVMRSKKPTTKQRDRAYAKRTYQTDSLIEGLYSADSFESNFTKVSLVKLLFKFASNNSPKEKQNQAHVQN